MVKNIRAIRAYVRTPEIDEKRETEKICKGTTPCRVTVHVDAEHADNVGGLIAYA